MGDIVNNSIDGLTNSLNWSSITSSKPTTSIDDAALIAIYVEVEFSSAFILLILSPITIFTNGIFLLALYRDSLKCFRKSASTFFVAGLSLADFITGLLVEPSFVIHYFLRYLNFGPDVLQVTKLIYNIGGTLSTIAISTSFVIVLAMSLSQYIAIRYPHQYKTIVTSKRVIRLVAISGLYFLAFSMLQFTGISRKTFLLLDVILHPTLISFLLVVVLILMRKAFQKHVSNPARNRTSSQVSRPTRGSRNEHNNRLEVTSSLTIRPVSASSSRIQVNSTQRSSMLSQLSGQDEISCKRPLHHNNNKSVDVRLTANLDASNPCNGDNSSTTFHHDIEPINAITHENFIGTDDNANGLKKIDQNIGEDDKENNVNNSVPGQCLSLRLKTLRHSFYHRASRKKPPVERQFAIMSFYLAAILLLSSISHTVVFYVFLLRAPESVREDVYVNIALRVTDLMLFLKVSLDAFIYAWRLPAYRRSLVKTISCGRIQLADDV